MSTVLLAGSIREANAYRLDTDQRHARLATKPAQLKLATKIIVLPGFPERRDRFALVKAAEIAKRKGAKLIDATDWTPPVKLVEEVEELHEELETALFGDLTDPRHLLELKAALNEVGYTLKKLPAKKQAEAPVVDAPDGI